jgi:hypothetical protein
LSYLLLPGAVVLTAVVYVVSLGLSDLFGETLTALVVALLIAGVLLAALLLRRVAGRERSH